MNKGFKTFLKILYLISFFLYAGVTGYFFYLGLLPMQWRISYLAVSGLFFLLLGFVVFKKKQIGSGLAAFLILIFMLTSGFNTAIGYYTYTSISTLKAINDENEEVGIEPNALKVDAEIEALTKPEPSKPQPQDAFNIYISGNDVYGDLSKIARSDVNLVLTVNMDTKKMLITTIPRDTYLPIKGGGGGYYDKLTHAGIYGIDSSVKTLEDFLQTPILYYARVNFSTMIKLVDALGGIDVDNPESFTSTTTGKRFSKGMIHLTGRQALAFSRERYHLREGDVGRGKNHIRVLKAMIEKTLSPALLTNYNELLVVAADYTDTNIPTKTLIDWINKELENPGGWEILTEAIQGTESMNHKSHAMPDNKLYMYIPSEESVAQVQAAIQDIMHDDSVGVQTDT